jgi:voltage-gated sodium channel
VLGRIAGGCARIVAASWFQTTVVVAILANSAILGLETYEGVVARYGDLLSLLNAVVLGLFTVEIAVRIVAYGRRPYDYFGNGWNVFDFVVVGSAYLPFVRESVTLLRLARLLRVTRLVSVLPGLRVVIRGLVRSVAPLASVALLTFFLLYVYAMVGWLWFGDSDPERFGDAGSALLTMFQVLTIEGWNEILSVEMEHSHWAWVFFISFILVGSFLVLNLVIAIVLNSVEEARAEEASSLRVERAEAAGIAGHPQMLEQRLAEVKDALAALEAELAREPVSAPSPAGSDGTTP